MVQNLSDSVVAVLNAARPSPPPLIVRDQDKDEMLASQSSQQVLLVALLFAGRSILHTDANCWSVGKPTQMKTVIRSPMLVDSVLRPQRTIHEILGAAGQVTMEVGVKK